MVYRATQAGTESVLYLREHGQLEPTPLRGTEGASSPFFSPDGESVAFSTAGSTLKRVSVLGGPAVTICSIDGPFRGGTWGADGTIVFATLNSRGLRRVAAAGGEPQVLTQVEDSAGDRNHWWPHVLPGGQAVIFTVWNGSEESSRVAAVTLTDGHVTTLVPGGTYASFAPSGHLVFAVGGTLRGVRFNPGRVSVVGSPVLVLEGVAMTASGAAQYALSSSGSLVYVPGAVVPTGRLSDAPLDSSIERARSSR